MLTRFGFGLQANSLKHYNETVGRSKYMYLTYDKSYDKIEDTTKISLDQDKICHNGAS